MKIYTASLPFGETVEGYTVPVLNERAIRAAAGLLFLGLFIAFMLMLFKQDFLLVKYVIVIFLTDFGIRIFISPRFSPTLIIGSLIVSRQAPEYVGAPQKKFAWTIGMALSSFMFFMLVIFNFYSSITFVICIMCLVFLFFESAFGICLACVVYVWLYGTPPLYCSGAACETIEKQAVLHISKLQLLIVIGGIVSIVLMVIFLNGRLEVAPKPLNVQFYAG